MRRISRTCAPMVTPAQAVAAKILRAGGSLKNVADALASNVKAVRGGHFHALHVAGLLGTHQRPPKYNAMLVRSAVCQTCGRQTFAAWCCKAPVVSLGAP